MKTGNSYQSRRLRVVHAVAAILAACALASCALTEKQDSVKYEATITRTTFGIPHIVAQDFGSLGFGAAYARAQDNICLMADIYLSFAGERSKYFGASGKTVVGLIPAQNVDSDVFYQAVPDLEALRKSFEQRSADYRALVDGWIAGYNRFLSDHKDALPAACAGQPWVREITRDDVLRSLNGFSILSSSSSLAASIANAAPPAAVSTIDAPAETVAAQHDGATIGSNGWAFGGDVTDNGSGLVIANPHFPWSGPNRFYETQLTIPGVIDVAGAAIMNLPYVGIGFNRDVAWTHTVDMAAHMTLYKLNLDPADPTAYIVDGNKESMTHREIRIEDQNGATIVRTLYSSRFGPLVSIPGSEYAWTPQTAYAVADANNGNVRSGDTWLDMARSKNVADVREALAKHRGAPFINTMAADRAGTALYADITAAPNVPAELFARCASVHERMPTQMQEVIVFDGSRADCAWETSGDKLAPNLLPAAQMATLYRRDFVQNSNDTYRWTNPQAPLQLGPIMGRDPGLGGLRTRTAITEIEALRAAGKISPDLAVQTMLSNRWLAADLAVPSLLQLCARVKPAGAAGDACQALSTWDRQAQLDSRGAMLFNLFWGKVQSRRDIWKIAADPNDPVHTPRDLITDGKTGDELLAALAVATETLKGMGLVADVALKDTQFAERGGERIPISGAQFGGVLNYIKTVPVKNGFAVAFGSSYIQSVTFDEQGPVADAILAYSQSADPASPYYADQTREFSRLQLHRFPYTEAEIAADAVGAPLTLRQ